MRERLFFERFGVGKPLVCVHGFPLDHSIWLPLLLYLQGKFDVILPDLRGYGRSPVINSEISLQDMAEDLLFLLDSLSLEKVLLVGHSMGGYVSLVFAEMYPERLTGLALTASSPFADSADKKNGRINTIEKVKENGVQKTLEHMPAKMSHVPEIQEKVGELLSRTSPQTVISSQRALAERSDRVDVLKLLGLPFKLILGGRDPYITHEMRDQLEKHFGPAAIVLLANSAHMPMMEEPKAVAQVLINMIIN